MDCSSPNEQKHPLVRTLLLSIPHNSRHLITFLCLLHSAVNENSPGSLQSFVDESNGFLSSAVSTVGSGGDGPAFASPLTTGQVAIMDVRTMSRFLHLPVSHCVCMIYSIILAPDKLFRRLRMHYISARLWAR